MTERSSHRQTGCKAWIAEKEAIERQTGVSAPLSAEETLALQVLRRVPAPVVGIQEKAAFVDYVSELMRTYIMDSYIDGATGH